MSDVKVTCLLYTSCCRCFFRYCCCKGVTTVSGTSMDIQLLPYFIKVLLEFRSLSPLHGKKTGIGEVDGDDFLHRCRTAGENEDCLLYTSNNRKTVPVPEWTSTGSMQPMDFPVWRRKMMPTTGSWNLSLIHI